MKSELYELIQKIQNDTTGSYPKISRPEFKYVDDFDRSTNTHKMLCCATISINDENMEHISKVFTNKKEANQNVCEMIYNDLQRITESTTLPDTIVINKKLLILIDHENINNPKQLQKLDEFLSKICYVDSTNHIEIIKFAGYASSA